MSSAATLGLTLTEPVMAPGSLGRRQTVPSPAYALGRSSEEQWLVQGLVPLLGIFLLGLNPLQPAFLDTVLAPGLPRNGGAWAGPAKAKLLCLPVAFLCLNPVSLPAMWELAPGLFVSSSALGPFLWGDASSLLGRPRDLRLLGRFGLFLLWRRREVYGVLESMAFAATRGADPCSGLRLMRDMFAALFFVSLGMLMDVFTFGDYLVPALIVSVVFILGKVVADTTGALLSGHDGRTSLRVGMGMPQLGEFSLAMVKTGVEHGTVGAFLNPVITVATAITALSYPIIFHSSTATANFISHVSPQWLREYSGVLFVWLTAARRAFILNNPLAHRVKHAVQFILLNMGIIVVIITLGTVALEFTKALSERIQAGEGLVGLIIGGATLALCIPSGTAIWRNLQSMTEEVMTHFLPRWTPSSNSPSRQNLRVVLRNSILILILILPTIWSIPFIARLVSLGSVATPVPALILIGVTAGVAIAAFQMHSTLEDTFRHTFLGPPDQHGQDWHQQDYLYQDAHLLSDDGTPRIETAILDYPYFQKVM